MRAESPLTDNSGRGKNCRSALFPATSPYVFMQDFVTLLVS